MQVLDDDDDMKRVAAIPHVRDVDVDQMSPPHFWHDGQFLGVRAPRRWGGVAWSGTLSLPHRKRTLEYSARRAWHLS